MCLAISTLVAVMAAGTGSDATHGLIEVATRSWPAILEAVEYSPGDEVAPRVEASQPERFLAAFALVATNESSRARSMRRAAEEDDLQEWLQWTEAAVVAQPTHRFRLLRADALSRVGRGEEAIPELAELVESPGASRADEAMAALLLAELLRALRADDEGERTRARSLLLTADSRASLSASAVDLGFFYLSARHIGPGRQDGGAKDYFLRAIEREQDCLLARIGIAIVDRDLATVNALRAADLTLAAPALTKLKAQSEDSASSLGTVTIGGSYDFDNEWGIHLQYSTPGLLNPLGGVHSISAKNVELGRPIEVLVSSLGLENRSATEGVR